MNFKKSFIKKHNNLITGIPDIDIQHKALFETIQFFETHNSTKEDLWNVLLQIEAYACVHFDTEEKYMQKFEYPKIDEHRTEHRKFIEKFTELKQKFDETGICPIFVEDFQNFLIQWLCKHYKDTDIEMAEFLKEKLEKIKNEQ